MDRQTRSQLSSCSDDYSRRVAQLVVGQLLQHRGIESVQTSALQVLEDILVRYIAEIGLQIHAVSELGRRTVCNPTNVVRFALPTVEMVD